MHPNQPQPAKLDNLTLAALVAAYVLLAYVAIAGLDVWLGLPYAVDVALGIVIALIPVVNLVTATTAAILALDWAWYVSIGIFVICLPALAAIAHRQLNGLAGNPGSTGGTRTD